MSSIEESSIAMASSVITSLLQSFRQVPPAAVPAFLDCVLSSTGVSPSTLVGSLIEDFPNLFEDLMKVEDKSDSAGCDYIASLVAGLCHLLEKFGDNHNALQLFMWRVFIPLMKVVRAYDSEMLNRILESFFDVVIKANAWDMLETNLVPFLLRSVGVSVGMLQHEQSDVIKWGEFSVPHSPNTMNMDEKYILSLSGSLPLPLSCHLLTWSLEAAFQNLQAAPVVEKFAANLLWDLCNMTERMLLQSVEHRSCAASFLLPGIFKAFASQCSLKISLRGNAYTLSRNSFLKKIWGCCKKLFLVGSLERRDAYSILSLFLSSVSSKEGNEGGVSENEAAEFDLRSERGLWDEIKKGLVDDESLVRKQSLHILKSILCISQESQNHSSSFEKKPKQKSSVPRGMTKREMWAEKEAKSLGVGKLYSSADIGLTIQQQWEAFLLLYEMLEEYGTHLVEAAWSNQVNMLIKSSFVDNRAVNFASEHSHAGLVETPNEATEVLNWLAVLWSRGFRHDNPLVRCMIMESFLGIEWGRYRTCTKSMPESFVLGPLMEGLNDPVHHKDFGHKGIYSSRTVDGAACFLCAYTSSLDPRHQMEFLINLASVAKKQPFGRAGLMGLVDCIASSAHVVGEHIDKGMERLKDDFPNNVSVESCNGQLSQDDMACLLDVLKFIMESSKQHFNSNYRIRVYQKVLEAAASVVDSHDVPLGILLQFVSAIPREFTDYGGSLREIMQEWLRRCHDKNSKKSSCNDICLLESLHEYLKGLISNPVKSFDDEDLDAWECQTKRWARVLFLVINNEQDLEHIMMFIQNHGVNICEQNNHLARAPVKVLILILSMLVELQSLQEGLAGLSAKGKASGIGSIKKTGKWIIGSAPVINEQFAGVFLSILRELGSFADSSCKIFWSGSVDENGNLPGSVKGKLGGPSQRRLSVPSTTAVLQAVTSVKAVALVSSYCAKFKTDVQIKLALAFLWKFFQHTISSQMCDSEAAAEVYLAAFEALASVLKAFVSLCSAQAFHLFESNNTLLTMVDGKRWLEVSVLTFLQSINKLLTTGLLVRTRRAVLLTWKWLCLESLLLFMHHCLQTRCIPEDRRPFLSDRTVMSVFSDIIESLENAGEDSVLPMLRSVRLAFELFASGKLASDGSSCNHVDTQMIWHLVNSCWILHTSCNKRRVAPIAALLSSVLHPSLFSNEDMHVTKDRPGPLKWFVEKVLEEGQKSPRTIRLAALHLTGLWLLFPRTIKYYIRELRLLTLYGSVAFDEDFEAELSDNNDARTEVSLLAKSPDPELTEVFINTELYARVSVAVLFHKLADLVNMIRPTCQTQDYQDILESGKLFLLELLGSAVHDQDLAKELYKKHSGIHRRKIRVWQVICILSRFVSDDSVGQVTESLHICLCRNNLPAVRQYIETFAINLYLEFPLLVDKQLVPILQNYDMKPQALSSYVFVAANIILHAPKATQIKHLDVLLPLIIPLLTSHHHSLRGFTQLLVHQVLFKLFPSVDPLSSQTLPLEKRSFESLKSYLDKNPDCARLRSSMEGYLDAYNPSTATTPAGVFVNRVEENEFESVPACLMDNVMAFLNDAREDLRSSMAKDAVTIKNETLKIAEDINCIKIMPSPVEDRLLQPSRDLPLDFQRKITLSKLEEQDATSSSVLANKETYKRLLEMEKEDELVNQLLRSRGMEVERLKAGRQSLILVASLLDRIPNLAGLARTCEVFKASGLAVADANVVHDKQFQLISVTAEKWVPIIEVPVDSLKLFLERKKREGFSILGLEQTANSIPLDKYPFPTKTVLVLGREKEGIPVDIIHILDACIEIPQLGVVRSLNVHVSGAIALWEYTRQQRT